MKVIITYICILFLAIPLIAQDDVDEAPKEKKTKIKINWKEKIQAKREIEEDYRTWERTYFNSPGSWYMSIEAGYSLPFLPIEPELVPPLLFLGNSDLSIKPDGSSYERLLLSSQGGGTRMALSIGNMFHRFIGAELKIGYFIAREDNLSTINRPGFKARLNTTLSEISISPQFVFQSPNLNNFYLVGKIGPYLPLWGNPRSTSTIVDTDGTFLTGVLDDPSIGPIVDALLNSGLGQGALDLLDYKTELSADVKIILQQDSERFSTREILRAVGVNASFGFRYQPSPIVSIFGEMAVKGYNISLAKIIIEDLSSKTTFFGGAITVLELTEEGGSGLGGITIDRSELISLLETEYVNELTEESNNPILNPTGFSNFRPRNELAPRLSVVSIGINVGIQFNFPGRSIYYRENSRKARK